ncbi:hypothetical protein IFM89_000423 [Coptis chinensis]|uniref:Uncharacterized protein n=1 Tax=Coptis chinensis TaxID=261450 RepID=A0A835I827_9MAGN|nr:hypothetical protein IFM89_000423 [Coptis chinensis]
MDDGNIYIALDKLPIKRLDVIEENGLEKFPPDIGHDQKRLDLIRRIDFAWAVQNDSKKQKTTDTTSTNKPWPWKNLVDNLHLAHQELSVIIDLINTNSHLILSEQGNMPKAKDPMWNHVTEAGSKLKSFNVLRSPEFVSAMQAVADFGCGPTDDGGGYVASVINNNEFWEDAKEMITAVDPLIKLLRMVDGKGGTLGYIYEAMGRVKEPIVTFFKDESARYEVEANDAVTVAGMTRPKPLPNEVLSDLSVSSASKLQCFRHLGKYFKQSAKGLEQQIAREARFYGALISVLVPLTLNSLVFTIDYSQEYVLPIKLHTVIGASWGRVEDSPNGGMQEMKIWVLAFWLHTPAIVLLTELLNLIGEKNEGEIGVSVNPKPDSKQSLYYVNDDLEKKKKSKILTDDPPNSNDSTYEDWMASNSMVLTWLWNSMEPKVLTNVQFLPTEKQVWSSLKEMYSQENNLSRIYDLFESLFKTKQGDQPIDEYYSTMKGLWEELLLYQPFTVNLEKQREQREHFQVALLLHGLNSEYSVYKDQILASETVPSAAQAFSRLKRKRLEHGEFVPVAKESSALLSTPSNRGGRGGFGGGRGFNGRGARGNSGFGRGNRGGFGGRRGRGDRYDGTDERKCTYCGKDGHTEPFCWDKHGKPAYAHNAYDQTFGSSAAGPSSASPPSTKKLQKNWKVKRQRVAVSTPSSEGFTIDLCDTSLSDLMAVYRPPPISSIHVDRDSAGMLAVSLPPKSCRSIQFGFLGRGSRYKPMEIGNGKPNCSLEHPFSKKETRRDEDVNVCVKETHSILRGVHRAIFNEQVAFLALRFSFSSLSCAILLTGFLLLQVFDLVNREACNPSLGVNVTGIRENYLELGIGQGACVYLSLVPLGQGVDMMDESPDEQTLETAMTPSDVYDGAMVGEPRPDTLDKLFGFPSSVSCEIYLQQIFHENVLTRVKDRRPFPSRTHIVASQPFGKGFDLLGHFCMTLAHRIFSNKVLAQLENMANKVSYLHLLSRPTWHSRTSSWSLLMKVPQSILHAGNRIRPLNIHTRKNGVQSQFETKVVVIDNCINIEGEGAPNVVSLFKGGSEGICSLNSYDFDLADLQVILLQQVASQVIRWLHEEALMVGMKASRDFLCLSFEMQQGDRFCLVAHVDPRDTEGCISWWLIMADGLMEEGKLRTGFSNESDNMKFLGVLSLERLYSLLMDLLGFCISD